ncbi:S8 family peptidase [Aestuariicella hydrocarbonica]|uniref:S8 family peptidase n=1 Tax=Pseudomaricurvus hydrocarbonicus TaxID=1470433 RepID=A0A9E5MNS6_9GAMM|nr:S8 family peptidase [Aestuariicella hydrocarbonica]NHO67689.1 S8 family peptidase [Aestuariicella hydrocarbonica]
MQGRKHLLVNKDLVQTREYAGSGRGNFIQRLLSDQQRRDHALSLQSTFNGFEFPPVPVIAEESIEPDPGIYVVASSVPDFPIDLEKLDNSTYTLCNVSMDGDIQKALFFIPSSKRAKFVDTLQAYVTQDRHHKHRRLFDNIATLRLADLQSFWTSHANAYPEEGELVWWEVWLTRKSMGRDEVARFRAYCIDRELQCGSGQLEFALSTVMLVKATREELAGCIELISSLTELRKVVDTAHFLLSQSPIDQMAWSHDIASRLEVTKSDVSVLILDSGVNYNHPLLEGILSPDHAFCWDESQSVFDSSNGHGTYQAGLAAFGDISELALHDEPILVNYSLGSCRIFNLAEGDDKDTFGGLTYFGVNKFEELSPGPTVVSLAVTADTEGLSGQPSSWSAELDQLSFSGESGRLFVVSAGNIRGNDVSSDYKRSTEEFVIEDPAQSWNALTVGAYTGKVDVAEHYYKDWSPLSDRGDISPTSRTSLNWDWLKQAPYKPDLVAEGGNLLLSPDEQNLTNADCVSLITLDDISTPGLFIDHRETSAATALVSRAAAQVWAEYSSFTSETVRALLVHSAEWTPAMLEYKDQAISAGVPPKQAKEIMLRRFGHGGLNAERAISSADSYVTMVHQGALAPYERGKSGLKLNEIDFISLPWPEDELVRLAAAKIRLRITLSYYIEPNPGRRAYSSRFSYQSHGLRFALINPYEELDAFARRINPAEDDYVGGGEDSEGWELGSSLRKRGALHQDTWEGSAIDLLGRNYIAVYPVAGWWKYKTSAGSHEDIPVRYSMIVSLDAGEQDCDLYSSIQQQLELSLEVQV